MIDYERAITISFLVGFVFGFLTWLIVDQCLSKILEDYLKTKMNEKDDDK